MVAVQKTEVVEQSKEELGFDVVKPSEAEIAKLKKQHGGALFGITLAPSGPDDDDGLYFVFRTPTRQMFQAAAAIADDIESGLVMLKNTMVWGSLEALEDMAVLQALSDQFKEINKPRVATLKKL